MTRPWMLVALWVAAGLAALIAGLAAIQTVRTAVGEPVAGANPAPAQPATSPSATDAPSLEPSAAATSPAPESATPAPATSSATAAARPTATAAPRPTSTQPAPPPAAATATLSSAGGTVVASCEAGSVRLLAWSPAPGYAVDEVEAGPSAEAEVRFTGGGTRVQVAVTCGAAGPEQRVRVSADGDDD